MTYDKEREVPKPGYLGDGRWILTNLTDITVLMGKNGSGKSILLRAWRDLNPHEAHYVVPERTGDLEYTPNVLREELDGELRKGSSTRNFAQDYRRRIILRVQAYFMTRGDTRGKDPLRGDPAELEELIGVLLPDFAVSLRATRTPPLTFTRVSNEETISQIDQLSSGEAQMLTVALDILTIAAIWDIQQRPRRFLLVDEPDPHLHPDLQGRFADFLVRVMKRFALQVLVATHSTSLMSALAQFGRNEASVIYLERNRDSFKAQVFDDVTREVAACLGGHVLMGPLFGAPLLLVEGDDDYRIWSQVPRHHVINIAVIPCHGSKELKAYQSALERILSSLSDKHDLPTGYALLDRDVGLPQPQPANPQNFIRFMQLECLEAENL